MEGLFGSVAGQGLNSIGAFLNWPFVIIFIISTYLVNKAVKSGKIKFKIKLRTFARSIILGLAIAGLFFWLNGIHTGAEVLRYIVSLIVTSFVLWGGVKDMITTAKRNWQSIKETISSNPKKNDYA